VWSDDEYDKLPPYDRETAEQPFAAFFCHQQDGRLCAGWVAVHDMLECLAFRIAAAMISEDDADAIIDYTTDVPLFGSGQEACDHGKREILNPSLEARKTVEKIRRRQQRHPVDPGHSR
jgi:hypothetical protein